MLSEPVELHTRLGIPGQAAALTLAGLIRGPMVAGFGYLAYEHAPEGMKIPAVLAELAIMAPSTVGYIKSSSMSVLYLLSQLRSATRIGDVEDRISGENNVRALLTLGDTKSKWFGTMNSETSGRAFVFFESDEPISDVDTLIREGMWRSEWGQAIEISDPKKSFIKVTAKKGSKTHPIVWEVPIDHLFTNGRLPSKIAEEWREFAKPSTVLSPKLRRLKEEPAIALGGRQIPKPNQDLVLQATLVSDQGREHPLGEYARSTQAEKFVGVDLWSRLKRLWNRMDKAPTLEKKVSTVTPRNDPKNKYLRCILKKLMRE